MRPEKPCRRQAACGQGTGKKRLFSSVEEAFDVLLKRGKPGYEPQPKLSPEESVELLHGAGGLAVLAHPAEIENLPLVNTLLSTIPFDGIEVYHPKLPMKKCSNVFADGREIQIACFRRQRFPRCGRALSGAAGNF